jgi:aspartate/methionine/tyrosine aminotransferase
VAGSAFGSETNLRISYATQLNLVIRALERIKEFVIKKSR